MSEFTHAELKLRFAESLDVIDRLTEQLNSKQDALSAALLALDNAVERCVGLEAELARYKSGVEVDDFVNHYGVLEAEYELRPDLWGKRVRVLVMKVEEE